MERYEKKTKKRRRLRIKRIIMVIGLLLTALVAFGGYIVYNAYDAANQSFTELERGEKSKLREEAVEVSKDPFSVLIMGVEDYSTGGENGRTDSLMVATFNPDTQNVKLLSIPRDSLVEIPGKAERDKINHAYAFGGKEATIESVEGLLNIPIDYYVTVGFSGFKDIIDEIDGVTVDVPFDFYEKSDVDNRRLHFTEGEMTLDGEKALAYARMRKQDPRGDFGRNDRQKQIITAVVDKMLSPSSLTKLDNIAQHIGENVQTNMRVSHALAIQKKYPNFNADKIEKVSLNGTDQYYGGIYYFEPDPVQLEELQAELQEHMDHETLY
ncbi:LytR family transcriptional regulator [Rossellomorea vietnamensis]|uniref:LytR family transcriptional regulator n=1 Tax=Rossellomorea vietnamensis TaxID=218284 RepID=A0A5D4NGN8_9BACI|nr:LCP family protein [Rossellomorea vietnamensis]TYS13097.1 LytR family transcriptional regulator [Rossellomorea vietnamensis]